MNLNVIIGAGAVVMKKIKFLEFMLVIQQKK
jgi:hypothetical protein